MLRKQPLRPPLAASSPMRRAFRQTSSLKPQASSIKDKENMSDNKKLCKSFLFFIENLWILLYNKQVYSCIIHL